MGRGYNRFQDGDRSSYEGASAKSLSSSHSLQKWFYLPKIRLGVAGVKDSSDGDAL